MIPADYESGIYTSASVANLNAKVNAVVYNLPIDEQERVDQFAEDILQAIMELEPDLADYTDVETAKTRAQEALNSSEAQYYTQASKDAVTEAVNAVVYDLPSREQARVTGFATAINTAVNNLAYMPIDDSAFRSVKTEFEARTDLANYTEASVKAVRDAITRGDVLLAGTVNIKNQSQLDAIVADINTAISNLQEKDANYAAVRAAIDLAYTKDPDLYTNFDIVTAALNAVVYDLKAKDQAIVDAYAEAINAAIAALEFKPIDTTGYEETQGTVPADLSIYTDASIAAVNAAKQEIDTFLAGDVNISHQSQLDALVATYAAKIAALAPKGADYTALNAVINEFRALNEDDYTNYYDAYDVYRSVNAWKTANPNKDITEQALVDEQTQALRDAIDALIPVGSNAYFRANENSTAVIDGNYIYGLKTNLTSGNILNTYLDYEGVEVEVEKAVPEARYYGTGSTVTVTYPDGTQEVYTIIIYGDVDGNAIIDIDDVFATLAAASDNSLFDSVQRMAANVDGVRRISVDDYMIIRDAAMGEREINQVDPSI